MRSRFRRVAVVNRGEPAMRFIHAALELNTEQDLGLRTIALFTEPDRHALFVREADEAYDLGPAVVTDDRGHRRSSYLDYERLERALVETRAEAAWVGWGFVAEHAEFAELCARLGIVFIGPGASVMRRLGDKIAAKRLAERAGVPVAAWSGGPVESLETALAQAETIGYPLVIKATAGGGGRGIRKVLGREGELEQAFASARSEALKAFGDGTVYIEQLLTGARHVEVQILADAFGTTWALGVRDCTVQRRNQKVIEESPSPALGGERDRALREAAVRLSRAAGYENAGTVEFLFDPVTQDFWFMEVNTRLQVEHPVTEVTTGLDLVKLQIHVAAGGRLPADPPPPRGHAIEVRLNAEDPDNGFAPAPGTVTVLRFPSGPGVRVDTGVQEGDAVPAEFDSMIAKVIAHGRDREEALARLSRALLQSSVVIRGGTSNKAFLMELLSHPDIRSGSVDVGWLDRLVARGDQAARRHAEVAVVRAALDAYETETEVERARFYSSAARGRPEVGQEVGRTIELRHGGQTYRLGVRRLAHQRYRVDVDGHRIEISVERLGATPLRERRVQGSRWRLLCRGASYRTLSVIQGLTHLVEVDGVPHTVTRDSQGLVRSPSPAIVVSVAVREGDDVAAGDRLLVLEAMKMETSVLAPFAGRVRDVFVLSNVQVATGAPLVLIDAASDEVEASGVRLRFDALGEPCMSDAPRERRRVLEELRALLLGFDLGPSDMKPLLAEWRALGALPERDSSEDVGEEAEVLGIFTDLCSLFRRQPADDEWNEDARLTTEEYLFTYLRNLEARGAGLPPAFVRRLQLALRHYGVDDLMRSSELEESVFRICKSHQREDQHTAVVFALLERCLKRRSGGGEADPEFRTLLDRMIAETQGRYPSVNDLAREVRFRYFERPLLEHARARVYAEVEEHLERLAAEPPADERGRRISTLVRCPQPLAALLSGRFQGYEPVMRQVILEVLTRRYYRIRKLEDVETLLVEGQSLAAAQYDHEGRRIHVFTTHAEEQRLSQAAAILRRLAAEVPPDHDVAIDVFVWRSDRLADPDASAVSLRATLDAVGFTRPIRRIVVALAGPGAERSVRGTQYFTFRHGASGFEEERFYRGVHPMMAKRLHMARFSQFDLERLPSVEDVYVLHGVARGNPRDERLFVMAEVRDLTPVRDESGRVVQLPHLERMFLEALGGIRRFQSRREPGQRLYGNRVLLYVWPVFDLRSDEMNDIIHKLTPAACDLGLETVVLRVRIPQADGEPKERVIYVSEPSRRGMVVSVQEPTDEPIRPRSEYELKVVRLAQRGLVYPYELVRMLTPPGNGAQSEFPRGEFIEHDLDGGGRLVPVSRPYGRNEANVVVGVVRSFTAKHPEGMSRVLLLGDPSRELGSLAEPECRRIAAALDLAERERIPVDWIALSAGAKIAMDSGTENMDSIARVLRRLVEFTQAGGEVNVVVNGINVGAQPYWNGEATILMHTRGVLVMTPDSAMVLTGKRALDYSGGVSAEDNQGIGGYERIMGPNGQAQYFARDLGEACQILLRHHDHAWVAPGEPFPRRAATTDPIDRDVCLFPYGKADGHGFALVGDVFSDDKNPGRKKPFDIRSVMAAVVDQDLSPLERWFAWQDAEIAVVWDAHLGGYPVCLLGIESRPLQRLGFVPADGPDQWTGGTLFPQSSRKLARALNAASGNRPVVVLANLTGFDGSPESLRLWQLEYGAEIGRAVVNFRGPLVFCVISRYHGGAFVVFSNALNDNLQVVAVEGAYASVIGGAPAAAVVFAREVDKRVADDTRVRALEREIAQADPAGKAGLRARLNELTRAVHSEKLGEVAEEFDAVHSVHRALRVGSVHEIIPASHLRPHLVEAVERGLQKALGAGIAPAESVLA